MTSAAPHGDTAVVAAEIAAEQAHVDKVYNELAKASSRAADVAADGLARGRTDRVGVARDEGETGLFERDALMYAAARRRASIDSQFEGLVFGRLDLGTSTSTPAEREVRHIGRLGVRDDDYEPLVIDWRAPPPPPSIGRPRWTPWAWSDVGCCAARAPRSSASRTT